MVSQLTRGVVLVTGATGRVGRLVVDELLLAGASVRALTRHPERAALPAGVEVVGGDFTAPATLDPALEGAGAVFLVWTAAPAAVPSVIARIAAQPRRVVHLSAPYRTPHPFFQQPNPDVCRFPILDSWLEPVSRCGCQFPDRPPWSTQHSLVETP